MNNLKKFANEADYSAATLNYPAVSWVVSGDTVHYDKKAPTLPNDKIMIAQTITYTSGDDFVLFNCGASEIDQSLSSLTLNDIDASMSVCNTNITESGTYVAKYGIIGTAIGDWFSGMLGFGTASDAGTLDVLIPAQITQIDYVPNSIDNMVVESTTPPDVSMLGSNIHSLANKFYVPDSAVNTYRDTNPWSMAYTSIYPISEYSGNLPV